MTINEPFKNFSTANGDRQPQLSPIETLQKLFFDVFGCTPAEYIEKIKKDGTPHD
jgi:hypothetical protein